MGRATNFINNTAWQLIGTAPKDGTRILLGWAGKAVRTGKWYEFPKVVGRWSVDVEYAPEYMPEDLPMLSDPPTHWQSLPESPFTEEELAAEEKERSEAAYYRVLCGV